MVVGNLNQVDLDTPESNVQSPRYRGVFDFDKCNGWIWGKSFRHLVQGIQEGHIVLACGFLALPVIFCMLAGNSFLSHRRP